MATRAEMEALKGLEVLFKWDRNISDFYHGFVLEADDEDVYFDPLYFIPIAGHLHLFELKTGISTVPKYPGFFKIPRRQSFLIGDPASNHRYPLSRITVLEVNR